LSSEALAKEDFPKWGGEGAWGTGQRAKSNVEFKSPHFGGLSAVAAGVDGDLGG